MEPDAVLTTITKNRILVVSSPNRDRYKVSAQDKYSWHLTFCCPTPCTCLPAAVLFLASQCLDV